MNIKPTGWQVLIEPYMPPKMKGSIHLPDSVTDRAHVAAVVSKVIALGPQCYQGEKYENTPWCQIGDWVLIGRNAGKRFNYNDKEFRLMNDDEILAIVEDPTQVTAVIF